MIPICEIDGIQYGICESSDINAMVKLLGEVFSLFDPPAVAVGCTAAEFEAFVRLFTDGTADDRLTIVARQRDTQEMIGALLTEDLASSPPDGLEQLTPKLDPIFDILGRLDTEYRQDKAVPLGERLHLFLLGVARSSGGRGVAQQLVTICLENGLRKGYRLAVTEATNRVSQHIFRKLGFIERVRQSYRDHRYEGTAFFAEIEEHGGPILMDRVIS